jgi:ribosomal protein L18E
MKSTKQTTNAKNAQLSRTVRSFNQLSKPSQRVINRLIKAHLDVEKRASAPRVHQKAITRLIKAHLDVERRAGAQRVRPTA